MTRRTRIGTFETRLQQAEARRRAEGFAARRIQAGTAVLADYQLVLKGGVDKDLERLVPTLTVVRALREHDVPASSSQGSAGLALAQQVLAYQPGESLTPEHEAEVARLPEVFTNPHESEDRRVDAAVASWSPWQAATRRWAVEALDLSLEEADTLTFSLPFAALAKFIAIGDWGAEAARIGQPAAPADV